MELLLIAALIASGNNSTGGSSLRSSIEAGRLVKGAGF
jgi:hypothetical protein